MNPQAYSGLVLVGFLLLSFGAAAVGSFWPPNDWYDSLTKPPLTPPGWLFGPAWTLLYTAMAVAAWLVWKQKEHPVRSTALILFFIQLALNYLWSPVFFGRERLLLALCVIVLLWLAIFATMRSSFRVHRTAGLLYVPYLCWVTFATYLNAGFWWLNR